MPVVEKVAESNPVLLQASMNLLINISGVEDQEVRPPAHALVRPSRRAAPPAPPRPPRRRASAPSPVASPRRAQLFKICLEYWNLLTSDLYHTECQFQPPPQSALVLSPAALSPASPRRQLYAQILSSLRVLLVTRMAKPEEVLVVESDDGEIIRETMKDSDAITMYKTMRETLVYLTHLSYDDTENIMLEKLQCAPHTATRPRPGRCALLGRGPHRLLRGARAGTRWTARSGRGTT